MERRTATEAVRWLLDQNWVYDYQRSSLKEILKYMDKKNQRDLDKRKRVLPIIIEPLDEIVERIFNEKLDEESVKND